MERYERFVIEAENDGIDLKVSEEEGGKIIVRAINIATTNTYSKNYENPPIPKGYVCLGGKWNSGIVIKRILDGYEFVWVPVGSLDPDGTLDGSNFSEKFGRRNYMDCEFSCYGYHEELEGEMLLQLASIKKYGGFYISRNYMSINHKEIWVDDYEEIKAWAAKFEDSETVKSHLIFGAEYDTLLAWFVKTGEISQERLVGTRKYTYIDSYQAFNNVKGFAPNKRECTQEKFGDSGDHVLRGGIRDEDTREATQYLIYGSAFDMSKIEVMYQNYAVRVRCDDYYLENHRDIRFRVALWIA